MGQQGLVFARHRRAKGRLVVRSRDSAVAATSSSSSRSSAAARSSTLSTMRRNMYPNCETDIIRRGRHHGRRHGRQLTTTATTRSASRRRSAIWCEARPLRGTLAEKYLRSRCIEVPDEALEVLRFHPRCPWGIGTRPAMVALVRDIITDEPTGIHRTALSADGSKIGAARLSA